MMWRRRTFLSGFVALAWSLTLLSGSEAQAIEFSAGAAAVEISPTKFPVIVNGGFLAAEALTVHDPLYARALVLTNGLSRVAIVVVDSCMMPGELIDQAKELITRATDIPIRQICISATHTHSAPSAMGTLGTPPDPDYVNSLPTKIAESVLRASKTMVPARLGFTQVDDFAHTHCRVWIRRPDKLDLDPFGEKTVRANMHPGYLNPDVLAPAGPVDPGLTVISVQSSDGKTPIAVLANYAMHYYGASPVSADYFGRFSRTMTQLVGGGPEFVAMMSQGTSGDQMWMDYGQAKADPGIEAYADSVAQVAFEAYRSIHNYQIQPAIAMAESEITLRRRVPDASRMAWARLIADGMGKEYPKNQKEVYAREAIILSEQDPVRTLKIQAIRLGELGLVAIPNEVYAISGLRIKMQSPFATTCVLELANGSEGYIPPPEQHALGGYTTWPARTAGLEISAEPKIVAVGLRLLERVSGRPYKRISEPLGSYAQSVLASRPMAYWRFGEMTGTTVLDSSRNNQSALLVPGYALGLTGPDSTIFSGKEVVNRCIQLAGGYIQPNPQPVADAYTVEFWFWNALPASVRPIVGDLYSLGRHPEPDERLRLVADGGVTRIEFLGGHSTRPTARGSSEIRPKTWNHVALVREKQSVLVYLNGNEKPEIVAKMPSLGNEINRDLYLGGTRGGVTNFEGKIDEFSIYQRALEANEILAHYRENQP